jgi:alanine dehydrogenase
MNSNGLRIGLARMHAEPGERRDFLPNFVARLVRLGAHVTLEHEYGSGLGLSANDYLSLAPAITFASHADVYAQDYVLALRCPGDEDLRRLRPGACLISMLHYPTRPQRVEFLRSLGIDAISLDSIKDDSGRRLVENLRSVAWNGVEAAFEVLSTIYPAPGFDSPQRPPIRATLLGAGAVGSSVMQAVVRYGQDGRRRRLFEAGVPGVQLTVVDYDLTRHASIMRDVLAQTDLLIDATQRPDASVPVIPNAWLSVMPQHAVLLDLSVDPYQCDSDSPSVKGIEGIPQGNLDQYQFAPDDPAYERIPACVATTQRRYAVSCYSWPGVRPRQCMQVYGTQLRPIFRRLIEKGGLQHIDPAGRFFERAISRARLSRWPATDPA